MKNYIEFFYDDKNNYIAKIHVDGRVRIVRNKKHLKELIKICEEKNYIINRKEGRIEDLTEEIAKEYDIVIREREIKVHGDITPNMKISRKKVFGTILAIAGLSTFIFVANQINKGKPQAPTPTYTTEISTEQEPIIIEINTETEDQIIEDDHQQEIADMLQQDEFHFSIEDKSNDDNVRRAKRYEDIFIKYGNLYGIDDKILMAIASQESSGDHNYYIDNGPAEGLMQIEKKPHVGSIVSAYNFETGKVEDVKITLEKLQDVDSNIKIATMLLQNCLEENNYNIPLAIQAYNFGPNNISKSLNMCSELEDIPKEELRNNPNNNQWLNYRSFLNIGDPHYVEHIFRYLESNTTLKVRDRQNNERAITIINDNQKKL